MEIVGRIEERKALSVALNASNSRLVAVYGRRRVGKTFLVREHLKKNIIFDITALYKKNMKLQLKHFQNTLVKYGSSKLTEVPKDWFEAFDNLEKYIAKVRHKQKKVIFIDEMSYFDSPRANFLVAFQNFWNGFCQKRKDLVVIVCGSSASWILKEILANKDGLHNRITDRIKLLPFTLFETEQFLKAKGIKLTRHDIVQLYMMLGGVPFYLDQMRKGEGLQQFIDRVCFNEEGVLFKEFDELYSSLFEDSAKHYDIISVLAKAKMGIKRDDILDKTKHLSGGNFTAALADLVDAGFVSTFLPINTKQTKELYRLIDPFSIFHFKLIQHTKSFGKGTWINKAKGQSYISWCGLAFEVVCLQHATEIKNALGLAAIHTEISAWRGEYAGDKAQIDLLIERADKIIHVCEMKFSRSPFVIDKKYAKDLEVKLDILSHQAIFKNKNLFLTMITSAGVKDNMYSQQLVQNFIDVDVLFR
jgi:uncharacterized protein